MDKVCSINGETLTFKGKTFKLSKLTSLLEIGNLVKLNIHVKGAEKSDYLFECINITGGKIFLKLVWVSDNAPKLGNKPTMTSLYSDMFEAKGLLNNHQLFVIEHMNWSLKLLSEVVEMIKAPLIAFTNPSKYVEENKEYIDTVQLDLWND